MMVDSSAAHLRTAIAKCLIAFVLGNLGGEEAALDLAELIAVRASAATDDEVATVGFYVRANLIAMGRGHATYCEVLQNLTDAAIAASMGPALKRSIEAGLSVLLR